jgi:hypothetical protein
MAKVIHPNFNIVSDLPSLKYIKDLRIPLYTVAKTLSAHRLANAIDWKQVHSDETSRRQVSLLNLLIGVMEKDYDKICAICLDLAILPKNSTAREQSSAIIGVFDDLSSLLTDWRNETTRMYSSQPELLSFIADPVNIDIKRLLGAMVEHDSCSTARKCGDMVCNSIIETCQEMGVTDPNELTMKQGDCHNHLRNVWFNAIDNYLGSHLEELLRVDLDLVPKGVRVSCRLSDVSIQCEKECGLTANYAKGHGDMFNSFLARCHPDKARLPIVRVTGGSRQDSSFESALPIYDMLDEILEFLHECVLTSDNKLQRSMFIILSSMEYIAQLRVASILFLSVVVPMRWLAGKTHELAHRGWGERSMGRAIDLLHTAFTDILEEPSLLLDYEFVMNIFQPLYNDLPEFEEFLEFYREDKVGNVHGSSHPRDRIRVMDLAIAEVFFPAKLRNRETTQFCIRLSKGIATVLLVELEDTSKATHQYVSACLGGRSIAVITRAEELSTVGLRATNDPSEGSFATFTDVLVTGGRISLQAAAGIGQMRYNGDMNRNHEAAVTGKKGKSDVNNQQLGVFHRLPEECTTSLVSMAKQKAKHVRKDFQRSLDERRAYYDNQLKQLQIKKSEKAKDNLIGALLLHKQFWSPACWRTVEVAETEYRKLSTKKAKLHCVKEQILMRYLGLGWVEAHHPWSSKGRLFTSDELFEHLIRVVIPLEFEEGREIPIEPPVDLPTVPDEVIIGTKSAARTSLDNTNNAKELTIRMQAREDIAKQEEMGIADQEEYMQPASWPVTEIKSGFKVQICWKYYDDEDGISEELRWCGGTVESVVKDKSDTHNYIDVLVRWDESVMEPGMTNPTQERLKRRDFNPQKHYHGGWRVDLSVLRTVDHI